MTRLFQAPGFGFGPAFLSRDIYCAGLRVDVLPPYLPQWRGRERWERESYLIFIRFLWWELTLDVSETVMEQFVY